MAGFSCFIVHVSDKCNGQILDKNITRQAMPKCSLTKWVVKNTSLSYGLVEVLVTVMVRTSRSFSSTSEAKRAKHQVVVATF